jgi:hypothetical protein
MKGKALAIITAAFCAGLFVALAPDVAPDVAAGPAEDSGLVVPHIVTIDKFAAMWAPAAAAIQRAIDRRRHNRGRDRNILTQGWPYCDPACLRGGHEADGVPAAHGTTVGRSALKNDSTASVTVNRTHKGNRLPHVSSAKQNPNLPSSAQTPPTSRKRVPLGCDPAFSSVADPARADIYKRCMV